MSTEKAIDRLESTIDRIDKAYLEKEQELDARGKTPTADYAHTATGKNLANLIDDMERSEKLLNNGATGGEDEAHATENGSQRSTKVDMDVTGGIDRASHLSERKTPTSCLSIRRCRSTQTLTWKWMVVRKRCRSMIPSARCCASSNSEFAASLRVSCRGEVAKVEQKYKRKYAKLQQLAAQEVSKRQAAYKQKVDLHYKKKELQLRKHYHKLMALANKVTAQKAQLQDARRQFEDKLQAANALYKEVEDMRTTLKKHLGGDIDVSSLRAGKSRDDIVS